MSGEVALVDSKNEAMASLIRTATVLFETPRFQQAALVGGLAVTIRLATAHRATNDIDAVTDGAHPHGLALQYIGAGQPNETNRIEVDGVKIDVMETWPLPIASHDLPEDDLERLFIISHRWAFESSRPVTVKTVEPGGHIGTVSGTLNVATAPALIACKLHAISDRRGSSLSKRDSDALDLFRLITSLVRSETSVGALSTAPFDLTSLVMTQVERWFVTDSLRTARLANSASSTGVRIDAADVSSVGRLLLDQLR